MSEHTNPAGFADDHTVIEEMTCIFCGAIALPASTEDFGSGLEVRCGRCGTWQHTGELLTADTESD